MIKPKEVNSFKITCADGKNTFMYSVEMKWLGMYSVAGFCGD
jgi:hypothetical protein